MESNDVRAIGICGMPGIGKTTLAKAFYNKYFNKFHLSCFIENMKPNSQGKIALLPILTQLLNDFQKRKDCKVHNAESGIKQLKRILCSKKALIIVDDVDRSRHSELLVNICKLVSAGSRIMITTRDVNLVHQLEVKISGVVDIYKVKELGDKESLELFSYHAFGKTVPPEMFREISVKFVNHVGGLPLALKILGSSLCTRMDEVFWKAQLEKVRVNPKLNNIVKLSYDELGDWMNKEIFLDIVFFFIGKDKDEAVQIFKSCGFFPDIGIPILQERCLLTVDQENEIQMHNMIRDTGKEVIREESKHGKCRRLNVCQEKEFEALQNLEGRNEIEALILDTTTWTNKNFSAEIFKRFPKLRLLEIIGALDIKGNFEDSFYELRCFRWSYCPWMLLPSSFCPPKLVSLNLPFSALKNLWADFMPPVSLKIVDLSCSENLKMITDFYKFRSVEKLVFHRCQSLQKVPSSIGQLINLSYLDFVGCDQLTELPQSIVQLKNLGHLNMFLCYNLKLLPEQFGDLKSLKRLDLTGTAIEQLPDSFGKLTNLVDLQLSFCENLISLPDSICNLKLLKVIHLQDCSKLEQLPEQFGNMESLERLIACGAAIKALPDSVGALRMLNYLEVRFCENLTHVPSSIWKLTSLEILYLSQEGTVRYNLSESVKNMPNLESLYMQCDTWLWLPTILSFTSLKQLSISHQGQSFTTNPGFSLSKLSNLQEFQLQKYTSFGSSFPELPPSLICLEIWENATLTHLPYSTLKHLKTLHVIKCINLQLLPSLPNLRDLNVQECRSLQDLPDLSNLKKLESLTVSGCISLKSVNLKESCLEVPVFKAYIPNWKIPEWFSNKSSGCTCSILLDIPPELGENFVGVALCVVFRIFNVRGNDQALIQSEGEVQSSLESIRADAVSVKSGDSIMVSFQRLLFWSTYESFSGGVLDAEMCGAHVIQNTPSERRGLENYRFEDDPTDDQVEGHTQDRLPLIPDLNEAASTEIDEPHQALDSMEEDKLDLTLHL